MASFEHLGSTRIPNLYIREKLNEHGVNVKAGLICCTIKRTEIVQRTV